MQSDILTPIFGNNTTKAAIIQSLSEKPLTLKELHNQVQKATSKNITYQALHKATQEMIQEEILEKLGKEITINKEWVEKLSKLTEQLKNPKEHETGGTKTTTYEFETFVDFGKFIIKFFNDAKNPENRPGICIMKHSWSIFGMSRSDYEVLAKMLKETTFYDLVENDTPLDKMFGKMLAQIGKKVYIGLQMSFPHDLVCKGDNIAQIYFSKSLLEKFDELYNKFKSIEEVQINDLMKEFMVQKTRISVIQIVDKDAANRIVDEALNLIKGKKGLNL